MSVENNTLPECGLIKPINNLIQVDFPAPFAPINTEISFVLILNDNLLKK
ncbi:uncharacterized protein METZ01_LOCUS182216 [marine metagenome]|uniref:Uncharacterized protein n=1 Tax=marine metagenome TaxID=408172 RepID=A0A382CU58_9ZZZZ